VVHRSDVAAPVQAPDFDLGRAPTRPQYHLQRKYLGRVAFGVRYSGRLFEIVTQYDAEQIRKGIGAERSEVGGFSRKSRRRLLKLCASIPWSLFEVRMFTTLTYPDEFPTDGREVKRHLRAFRNRFERRWGRQAAVWKLEFQRRGAPHFHFLLSLPAGADHEQFRAWLSAAWFEIVASGDLRHLRAGTQAQVADTDCGRYFAYGVKSSGSKEYQNQVPENFENVGRFWGNWNIAPEWKGAEISSSDFVELRRRMCAWSKSKGGFVPSRSRVQGGWLLTEGLSAAMVLSQLARGLPSVERLVV
jgi:hypothetical protein